MTINDLVKKGAGTKEIKKYFVGDEKTSIIKRIPNSLQNNAENTSASIHEHFHV